MKVALTLFFFALIGIVSGQDFRDAKTIRETITIENLKDFWIIIENINGTIEIVATQSNEVVVDLSIQVAAEFQDDLVLGMSELGLKKVWKPNRLILAMDAPFIKENTDDDGNWQNWNCNTDLDYEFTYDYRIQVPEELHLKASTVNKGDVFISGMKNVIKANNVNGDIEIREALDVRYANTVNGSIKVSFENNPAEQAIFHTINGDITLIFKENLNARVFTKSMNGEVYSSFGFEYLQPVVELNQSKHGHGTTYKISEKTGIEIGQNGPELKLETLNGNMYLKKI